MRRWKMTKLNEVYNYEDFYNEEQPYPLGVRLLQSVFDFYNNTGDPLEVETEAVELFSMLFWEKYENRFLSFEVDKWERMLLLRGRLIKRKYADVISKMIDVFNDSKTTVSETITQDGKDALEKNVKHEGESSSQTTSGDDFEDNITTSKTSENKNIPSPIDVNTTAQNRPNQFVVGEDETQTHSTGTRDTETTTGGESSSNEDTEETKEWESELVKESTTTIQSGGDVDKLNQYVLKMKHIVELMVDEFSRLFVGLIYAD